MSAPSLPKVELPPLASPVANQVGGQVTDTVNQAGQTVTNTVDEVTDTVDGATDGLPQLP